MDKRQREHLGKTLRKGRERLGLSQAEMAELVGLQTHNSISNAERGYTLPPLTTIARAAEVIGVPLYSLFTPDPLIPAPETMREDERVIMESLTTMSDADVRMMREVVDVILRNRAVTETERKKPSQQLRRSESF